MLAGGHVLRAGDGPDGYTQTAATAVMWSSSPAAVNRPANNSNFPKGRITGTKCYHINGNSFSPTICV